MLTKQVLTVKTEARFYTMTLKKEKEAMNNNSNKKVNNVLEEKARK